MKLLSAKVQRPDGSTISTSRSITDAVAQNDKHLNNALLTLAGKTGKITSYQIIDTLVPRIMETVGHGSREALDESPRAGIQHADAVGIVDGESSGSAPADQAPDDLGQSPDEDAPQADEVLNRLEENGTLATLEDMGVDVHPALADVIEDMEPDKPKRGKK